MTNSTNISGFIEIVRAELMGFDSPSESERFAYSRLSQRLAKRMSELAGQRVRQSTLEKFCAINIRARHTIVDLDPFIVHNARVFIARTLERFTDRLDSRFPQESLHLPFLFDHWRFGPGASNEVKGTHTADKIMQDMSCTVLAEPLVALLRGHNTYFKEFDLRKGSLGTRVIRGSKLTTVPKNEETERTIATEPSGNMCLQLAAGVYLEGALRSIGLDIRSQQPKNKALAWRGSIDGSLSTIDLSYASDLITPSLVRLLMPRRWTSLLNEIRSEETCLPSGEYVKLGMQSTMGNGYTFPLMTLILTSLVYANRLALGLTRDGYIDWRVTAVFGDDIIVPTVEALPLIKVLEAAGLIVNYDKSYLEGPFRESCGGDYHSGVEVTPFYVRALNTKSEIYVAINQVLDWSAKHKFLPRTLEYLLGILEMPPYLVPEWENPDSGILYPYGPRRYKLLRPRVVRRRLSNSPFAVMLACGGYISEDKGGLFFVPRAIHPKVQVHTLRIPKGYVTGRCVFRYSDHHSDRRAALLSSILT